MSTPKVHIATSPKSDAQSPSDTDEKSPDIAARRRMGSQISLRELQRFGTLEIAELLKDFNRCRCFLFLSLTYTASVCVFTAMGY